MPHRGGQLPDAELVQGAVLQKLAQGPVQIIFRSAPTGFRRHSRFPFFPNDSPFCDIVVRFRIPCPTSLVKRSPASQSGQKRRGVPKDAS